MHPQVHLGRVELGGLQAHSHRIGGNLQEEEAGEGKLHSMRSDSGGIVPEGTHVEAT